MTEKEHVDYGAFADGAARLAAEITADGADVGAVVSIARGGLPLGVELSHRLGLPHGVLSFASYDDDHTQHAIRCHGAIVDHLDVEHFLVVDDVCDSGVTLQAAIDTLSPARVTTATLHTKPHASMTPDYVVRETDAWVVYPWEH